MPEAPPSPPESFLRGFLSLPACLARTNPERDRLTPANKDDPTLPRLPTLSRLPGMPLLRLMPTPKALSLALTMAGGADLAEEA